MLCLFSLKLPTVTYTQEKTLRKLAGLTMSIRGLHVAHGPVIGRHWLNQTTHMQSSFHTLHGLLCMQACGNIHKV